MADPANNSSYASQIVLAPRMVGREDAIHDAIALLVTDALPQMIWSALPNGYCDYFNAQWYAFTGKDVGATDGNRWIELVHTEDRETCWTRWQQCLTSGERYEAECRMRRQDGMFRWMSCRAEPVFGNAEATIRWVGTMTDVHEAKLLAQARDLLAKEMDHRIANIFAIVGSLIVLEAQNAPSAKAVALSMQARLASLNSAHRLVRHPVTPSDEVDASVHSIIRAVIKPYQDDQSSRFIVSGTDCRVNDGALTAIALLVHELCTNAFKYGALTLQSGTIAVTTDIDGPLFKIEWEERGGPALDIEPLSGGFGTVLISETVERQLGGTIERIWNSQGLRVEVTVPMSEMVNDLHAMKEVASS